MMPRFPAYGDGLAAQTRIGRLFDRGEEGIGVKMNDTAHGVKAALLPQALLFSSAEKLRLNSGAPLPFGRRGAWHRIYILINQTVTTSSGY